MDQHVPQAPMELVKCHAPAGGQHCGLVQTRFTYDLGLLYGGDYGYRSGLNRSMVLHLEGIVRDLLKLVASEQRGLALGHRLQRRDALVVLPARTGRGWGV